MMAHEIEAQMLEILKELDGAYRREEEAQTEWNQAEEDEKLARARSLLIAKAKNGKLTVPELEAMCTIDANPLRLKAITHESQYKRAKHDIELLEKQLFAYQTLMGMERTKLERIHLEA